jgi:serine/threonine protein kinase
MCDHSGQEVLSFKPDRAVYRTSDGKVLKCIDYTNEAEAFLYKRLKHPNIPKAQVKKVGDRYHIIMDSYKKFTYLMTEEDKIRMSTELLSAIKYIHSLGYAHLDIKSDNILFTYDGKPMLIDYDCACHHTELMEGMTVSRVRQSPPEIFLKDKIVDARKYDMWCAGIYILSLFSGKYLRYIISEHIDMDDVNMTDLKNLHKVIVGDIDRHAPVQLRGMLYGLTMFDEENRKIILS